MSGQFGRYLDHHSDPVSCPKCGAKGAVDWDGVSTLDGEAKELVHIEGNFYERLSKAPPHAIELVCNGCGTVQQTAPGN